MASTIIDDAFLKEKCQVFTPRDIIDYMLDLAGYSTNLYGKRILENSCGDGEVLVRIVNRYLLSCKQSGMTLDRIKDGLETDIVAYDVDLEMVECAKKRLDALARTYDLTEVQWKIYNADFLENDTSIKFDYIVGNPPYIAYADLPEDIRTQLRKNFSCCEKGKFDYSYAFIEHSYKSLKTNGQLVYIIPCYILKNVFAQKVRDLIKMDVRAVIEFKGERVFKKALVTPVIIQVQKDSNISCLHHQVYGEQDDKLIKKEDLGDKWCFSSRSISGTRIGDHFVVSSCIATLCNEAFVVKGGRMEGSHYVIGENKIEKSILREATTPKRERNPQEKEYIIFPYYFDEQNNLFRYSQEDMEKDYPACVKHLKSFKDKLDERCADDAAAWFEYGRSQAIQNMNREKIMISSIISEQTKAYLLSKECIPYSGIYIIPKGKASLEQLLGQLNSKEFKAYVDNIGVNVSGSSKRITTHDIEEFVY